jgi:hypothetical protein
VVDDVPRFEFGIAEHLGVVLADKQPRQRKDVVVGTSANARREFLCLGFQLRRQGFVQRHACTPS